MPSEGSTVLHIDISDAVNIIMYVGQSQDVVIKYDDNDTPVASNKHESSYLKKKVYTLRELCEDTDEKQIERIKRDKCKLGALWHIYHPNDIDKIRHFINKLFNEKGQTLPAGHDPIHDQAMYLDSGMRKRLYQEYGVRGWAIAQCEGDAVLIPAGAPHQVRNLQSCIKIAEDHVSPERVGFCLMHTEEIRHLSKTHSNHEDKLQMRNLLYHAVKECVSVLQNHIPSKEPCTCKPIDRCAVASQATPAVQKDDRDELIEQLQNELDKVKRETATDLRSYQQVVDAQEVTMKKIKKRYDHEHRQNKEMRARLDGTRQPSVSQLKNPHSSTSSTSNLSQPSHGQQSSSNGHRSHTTQIITTETYNARKQLAQTQLNKLRATKPAVAPRPVVATPISTPRGFEQTNRGTLMVQDPRKVQYPVDYRQPPQHNARDPRLKHRMVENQPELAHAPTPIPGNFTFPSHDKMIPKSAFQGVQHAVQDLRKKQPPPQKMRKTPETPEPMDTNQDSCSPKPGSSKAGELPGSSTQGIIAPKPTRYDQVASNSETDSNEDPSLVNENVPFPQFPSRSYVPLQQPSKAPVMQNQRAFSSPSVSPGFHPKSLNLQISSPKQPAIFSNKTQSIPQGSDTSAMSTEKKSTYQKVKEEMGRAPHQPKVYKPTPTNPGNTHPPPYTPPATLSEIFPTQPYTTNTYSNVKSLIQKQGTCLPIKHELRTPPNEKANAPSFAHHLASYLPELLTRPSSGYEGSTWYTDPRSTQSPETPTLSPALSSQPLLPSPATPSPPPTCISLVKPKPVVSHHSPASSHSSAPSIVDSASAPIVSASICVNVQRHLNNLKPQKPKLELTRANMQTSSAVAYRVGQLQSTSYRSPKERPVLVLSKPEDQGSGDPPIGLIDTDKLTVDVLSCGIGMPPVEEPATKKIVVRERSNSISSESFESISSTPSDQSVRKANTNDSITKSGLITPIQVPIPTPSVPEPLPVACDPPECQPLPPRDPRQQPLTEKVVSPDPVPEEVGEDTNNPESVVSAEVIKQAEQGEDDGPYQEPEPEGAESIGQEVFPSIEEVSQTLPVPESSIVADCKVEIIPDVMPSEQADQTEPTPNPPTVPAPPQPPTETLPPPQPPTETLPPPQPPTETLPPPQPPTETLPPPSSEESLERTIIFDTTLMSRLRKTRISSSESQMLSSASILSNPASISKRLINNLNEITKRTEGFVTNPLLRRKPGAALLPQKITMPRKSHLTDTVDAILKSDTPTPASKEQAIPPAMSIFDKIKECISAVQKTDGEDPPVLSPKVDMPVLSPKVDMPVLSPKVDMPVLSPKVDMPVLSPKVDMPVLSPKVDMPVLSPKVDMPVLSPVSPGLSPAPSEPEQSRPVTPPAAPPAEPPVTPHSGQSKVKEHVQSDQGIIIEPNNVEHRDTVSPPDPPPGDTTDPSFNKKGRKPTKKSRANYRHRSKETEDRDSEYVGSDEGPKISIHEIEERHKKRKKHYERDYRSKPESSQADNTETPPKTTEPYKEDAVKATVEAPHTPTPSRKKSPKRKKRSKKRTSSCSRSSDKSHRTHRDYSHGAPVKRERRRSDRKRTKTKSFSLDDKSVKTSSESTSRKSSLESIVVYHELEYEGTRGRSRDNERRSFSTDRRVLSRRSRSGSCERITIQQSYRRSRDRPRETLPMRRSRSYERRVSYNRPDHGRHLSGTRGSDDNSTRQTKRRR